MNGKADTKKNGYEKQGPKDSYQAIILNGNEPSLMREALARRSWWRETAAPVRDGRWHLWWGANGQRFDFTSLAGSAARPCAANRLFSHKELCTKTGLARTLDCLARIAHQPPAPSSAPHPRAADPPAATGISVLAAAYTGDGGGAQGGVPPHTPGPHAAPASGLESTPVPENTGNSSAASSSGSGSRLAWVPETHLLSAPGGAGAVWTVWAASATRCEASGEGRVWIVKPAAMNRGNGIDLAKGVAGVASLLRSKKPGLGGITYWLTIFPVDCIKSAMQTDSIVRSQRKYTDVLTTARLLWGEGGVRRFYKGFAPCLIRAAPANGVMLLTVDKVTTFLNKQ